jgi:hypothetical protein
MYIEPHPFDSFIHDILETRIRPNHFPHQDMFNAVCHLGRIERGWLLRSWRLQGIAAPHPTVTDILHVFRVSPGEHKERSILKALMGTILVMTFYSWNIGRNGQVVYWTQSWDRKQL